MKELVHGAAKIFEAHRRANADRIRAGIEAGLVAPCDADALVQLVRAVIDGLVIQRVTESIELEPVHRLLWENLLAPLERTPGLEIGVETGAETGVREALPATQNDARPQRSSTTPSATSSATRAVHRSETTEEPRS